MTRGDDPRRPRALLVVLLLALCAYAPSLTGDFVYDDRVQILGNPNLESPRLETVLLGSVWAHLGESNNYRPTFNVWLVGHWQAFGAWAPPWRTTLLAVHLAVVALVYLLARRLALTPGLAALAALLFGLHPQRATSVAWISGATDPLMLLFGLGALVCLLRALDPRQEGPALGWRGASVACFALSLGCKEPALTFLGPLAVIELAHQRGRPTSQALGRAALALAPCVFVVAAYLGLRSHALGGLEHRWHDLSLPTAALTAPVLLDQYLLRAVLPWNLALGPDVRPVESLSDPRLLAGGAVLLALLLLSGRMALAGPGVWRRRALLALAWCPLVLLLDVRNLPKDFYVQDRYVYATASGASILLALALGPLLSRHLPRRRWAFVLLGLALALGTGREAWGWRTNEVLFRRSAAAAPSSAAIQYGRGVERLKAGDPATAVGAFQRAVEEAPELAPAWEGLGRTNFALERYARARSALKRARALTPESPNVLLYLARSSLQVRDLELARSAAEDLARLKPGDRLAEELLSRVEAAEAAGR